MPGTVVATTITDGAMYSTSVTNLVTGSVKAWVYFNGVTPSVFSAYNITSITKVTTGKWYADVRAGVFSNGNYAVAVTCDRGSPSRFAMTDDTSVARTATRFYLACSQYNGGYIDVSQFSVACYG